ncbi:MAG: PP2C family protein-serine/threonine phosphatase [Chloroflexota bacterium]
MEAAAVSEKGMRAEMEDAHYLDLNLGGRGWVFGGVYDGHGGSYAAGYAAKRLHEVFLEKLLSGTSPQEAFTTAYETTSEELSTQDSGTTAVTFLIRDRKIFTANVGDARALVIGKKGFAQLTVDHRLDNPAEKHRIEEMGGVIHYPYVYRGFSGLMPTRTLGDQYFKAVGVIATPLVGEHPISPEDLVLVAACDGLFDVMTNEEVRQLARKYPQPQKLVEVLRDEALLVRQGTDNLTVIAISLPP